MYKKQKQYTFQIVFLHYEMHADSPFFFNSIFSSSVWNFVLKGSFTWLSLEVHVAQIA